VSAGKGFWGKAVLCPRCNYDLTGLPETHVCPECGCPYDSHSTAIPLSGRRTHYLVAAMYLPLVGGLLWFRGPRLFTAGNVAVLGTCVATAIGTIVAVLRRGGLPTRLILHHEGIELVTPGQEPLTWPWHVIAEAAVSRVTGRFKIAGKDGTELYARHYGRLGRFSVVERCAKEINARVGRYSDRATP
jgi:hypothetical protein